MINVLIVFIVTIFFKQMLWMGLVPLWQYPDEPSHFSDVQKVALDKSDEKYTSDEIAQSELWLDVFPDRDTKLNKFSFHPEYNIKYSKNYNGIYESEMDQLRPLWSDKFNLVEGTSYPKLYYRLASVFYHINGEESLINRVFVVRFFSIILMGILGIFSFKLGQLLFKKPVTTWLYSVLVLFHPMLSYMGSAVNSDLLFITLFTMYTYGLVRTVLVKDRKSFLIVLLSLILGTVTKQQMVLAIVFAIMFYAVLRRMQLIALRKIQYKKILLVSFVTLPVILYLAIKSNLWFVLQYTSFTAFYPPQWPRMIVYFSEVLSKTYTTLLPWYWGVFKWLGVTLPGWVLKIQMILIMFAGLGLLRFSFRYVSIVRANKTLSRTQLNTLMLAALSVFYYLGIILWDWQYYHGHGDSFGLQGRYFLPTVAAHMYLLIIGLYQMCAFLRITKLWNKITLFLTCWWIVMHLIAQFTIARTYYETVSISAFIIQASQYKPWYYKGDWWGWWIGVYILELFVFTIVQLKLYASKTPNKTSQ